MATTETRGVMGYVDESGGRHIHYPVTEAGLTVYDPAKSGLPAENAQDAIDAVSEAANAANSKANNALQAAQNAQQSASAALEATKKMINTIYAVPSQSGEIVFDGKSHTPVWNDYDPEQLTMSGQTSGTDAGTYNTGFTPKGDRTWPDGSKTTKTVQWVIKRAAITPPTQKGTRIYTGSEQSPEWNGLDESKMTLGGTTKGTNAGTYDASVTPKSNYQWSDGTYGARTVRWTISAAAGSLSLSPASLTLDVSNLTKTIEVTRAGDGKITVQSSNTAVAEATLSGTTVTVKGKAKGSVTITVKVAAGTNHTAPADKTVSVTVNLPSKVLSENSLDIISAVSKAGIGDTLWDVGDTYPMKLNGTIGTKSFSNLTLYVYIVHFNMPTNKNTAENNIIWQGFKSAATNGKDVALRDWSDASVAGDYKTDGTKLFNMNHWDDMNYGGWKGCDLRYDILGATSTKPSDYGKQHTTSCVGYDATAATLTSPPANTVFAAMPAEWRGIMRLWTRYIDAVGNSSNADANIKATVDAITLLAEYEVFGTRSNANLYEQNHQVQVDYYKNGNSPIRYAHDSTGQAVRVWEASPYYNAASHFCYVDNNGNANVHNAGISYALAPAFKT